MQNSCLIIDHATATLTHRSSSPAPRASSRISRRLLGCEHQQPPFVCLVAPASRRHPRNHAHRHHTREKRAHALAAAPKVAAALEAADGGAVGGASSVRARACMSVSKDKWMDGRTNGWMDGQMDERVNGALPGKWTHTRAPAPHCSFNSGPPCRAPVCHAPAHKMLLVQVDDEVVPTSRAEAEVEVAEVHQEVGKLHPEAAVVAWLEVELLRTDQQLGGGAAFWELRLVGAAFGRSIGWEEVRGSRSGAQTPMWIGAAVGTRIQRPGCTLRCRCL
eukprot:364502-Chlamydomonas_euryale.AAC.17